MPEHLLEIKIVQPGRATGQYYAVASDTLRLEKIVQPEEELPFDMGILPTSLTPFDEPFAVLVLGNLSHPINTEIESKLLGAAQRANETPFLLAVPTADERAPQCLNSLTAEQCAEIIKILNRACPGVWRWLAVEDVEPRLHTAALRYRQKQADGKLPHLDPAWQPIHVGRPAPSFIETERYTPAEYTFYELPYRFQYYISEYLAPDERILYALRRPAMESQRKRHWLRREQLQAGVLILTSQRLIHLAELVPPDSANIRYGFRTEVGVLERIRRLSVSSIGDQSLLLSTSWNVVITHIFCARQKTKPQPRITRMRANFLNQFVKIREIRGKMLWL